MVWYGQPLMAIILLAALQTIPRRALRAPPIDGASAWQRFRLHHAAAPHAVDPVHRAAAHDLDVEPHRHDLHPDARRPRILQLHGGGLQLHADATVQDRLFASAVAVVLTILLVVASAFYVRHLARRCSLEGDAGEARGGCSRARSRSSPIRSPRSCGW